MYTYLLTSVAYNRYTRHLCCVSS